jgi:hypothetical protein
MYLDRIKHKITSAPEMIEPIDVSSYTTLKQNKAKYRSFEKDQKKLIHTLDRGVVLYQIPKKDAFIVLDHNSQNVLYDMRYELHAFFGHEFAVQRFIWASPRLEKPELKIKNQSVTTYVFFNLLLKIAGGIAIATDAFHTPDGKRFWLRRVTQAFSAKKHVYLVDMDKDQIIKIKNDLEFEQKIEDMETWIKDTKGQNRRVIISSKPISW